MFESAIIFLAIGLAAMNFGVGLVASLAIGLAWILFAIGLISAAEDFFTGKDNGENLPR